MENDRFLSGVCQPLSSLSGHPEEKPTCSTSHFKVTVTGTGTGTEKGVIKEGGGGKKNWREFRSLPGFLYGSVHPHVIAHLTTFLLGLAFLRGFSLSYLCLNT